MKIKSIVTVLFVAFILVSCAPKAKGVPSEMTIATSTFTPSPTATITLTPIPMINVEGQNIPDPRFSNPEFFDFNNSDSPIVQFANAFGLNPEEISAGLKTQMETPDGMPAFVVVRTSDDYALMIAIQDSEDTWQWKKAVPGNYGYALGKKVGLYTNYGDSNGNPNATISKSQAEDITAEFFQDGILLLSGQVRPNAGRAPENASRMAQFSHDNNMALDFNYVASPGKFPDDVNSSNIDGWLSGRFNGIIQLLKNNKTEGHPMHITFLEAWEGPRWNTESNPLKDKYSEQWVSEYIYQLLTKFIDADLTPNKDFIINFNDANLWNHPEKQDLIFNVLTEARQSAFDRMQSDPLMKQKLEEMDITATEDIDILVTIQTNTKLGENIDNGTYFPEPTPEQVNAMADKFASLGGIIVELNPHSKDAEKHREFIAKMFDSVKNNPNIKGLIFFNIFNPNDPVEPDQSNDIPTFFNDDGSPTSLLFELLR